MSNKIKSIFLGQIRRKTYRVSYYLPYEIREETGFVKNKKFYECELDRPPLEKDKKIYIPEFDVTLQVSSVIKSVDGSITYHTNYTIEVIEDEESKESLEKANKELQEKLDGMKEIEKPIEFIEYGAISRNLGDGCIATYKNPDLTISYTNGDSITVNENILNKLQLFLKAFEIY